MLVGAGGLAALVVLRWVGPVLSAALWTLGVAGTTWAAVCLGLRLMTSVRPPAVPGDAQRRTAGNSRFMMSG